MVGGGGKGIFTGAHPWFLNKKSYIFLLLGTTDHIAGIGHEWNASSLVLH